MRPEAKPNPLAGNQPAQRGTAPEHPMMQHARIWQHVSSLPPDQLAAGADRTSYVTPLLGALSSDPKVTAKDVIKAAAAGVADGKATPSEAIAFISKIPDDPEKVQPWLKGLYVQNLSAAVHMKAAQLAQQAPVAPPGAAQPVPAAPGPGQAAPAMPGAAP